MALVRVERVAPLGLAVRDTSRLEPGVQDIVYARMSDYLGQNFDGQHFHTERLAVRQDGRRHAIRVLFFVDADGTLNVVSMDSWSER